MSDAWENLLKDLLELDKQQEPKKAPNPNKAIYASAMRVTVECAYDGTETLINLVTEGGAVFASGRAKRRKGDKADRSLGMSLATKRAFQAAADREGAFLKTIGYEE
jgi:hypothetical protein